MHRRIPDILAKWKELFGYFNDILDVSDAYLQPDQHDKLLVDDDAFSRSKKNFWAITTLKEIDKRISDNIREISELIESRASSQVELEHKTQLEFYGNKLADELGGFDRTAGEFRLKRLEAIDLRDGVRIWNLTYLVGSWSAKSRPTALQCQCRYRQSSFDTTSDNIKLLTFVSIFFLPLSFCMVCIPGSVKPLSEYILTSMNEVSLEHQQGDLQFERLEGDRCPGFSIYIRGCH